MFKNYLKIALRNIIKYKGFSLINIIGLSIGMACTILIMLWVQDERSYDKFYENSERIYRVIRGWYEIDSDVLDVFSATTPPALGHLLKNDYPQDIDELVRVSGTRTFSVINIDGRKFKEERVFHAEDNFFKIFKSSFIAGNPESALDGSGNVVITESTAKKYFDNENPMGKIINHCQDGDLKITGVIKDVPYNSHFKFDIIVSMSTLTQRNLIPENMLADISDWRHSWFNTYILLNENVSIDNFKNATRYFIGRHRSTEENEREFDHADLDFQPLESIHLHSNYVAEIEENGRIEYVYIFSGIAILILLLACINFMNLSTARSMRRSKEIGVRKVSGAGKMQIVRQFITESAFISVVALILAIVLVEAVLPSFNNFVAKELALNFSTFLELFIICIITGLLAGSYPAFYISAFNPIAVLKSSGSKFLKGVSIRRILVITQFAISVLLICCLGIISNQMFYLKDIDLGYNRDNIVIISVTDVSGQEIEVLKERLLQYQNIKKAGSSDLIPTHPLWNGSIATTLDGENRGLDINMYNVCIDYDFFDVYNISMIEGRSFSREFGTDSLAFVINETAVKELGWEDPQNALNRPLEFGEDRGTVIGVVKDIHFESLHNEIIPTVYYLHPTNLRKIAIRVNSGDFQETLSYIKEIWYEYQTDGIFEYALLDDKYNNLYKAENNLGQVIKYFSFLAVFIACLGLLGLSSFTVEQRIKEIGVRKVNGARVYAIINHLLKEFIVLVCIANVIAWPVAYYFMNKWLQNFAYSVNVKLWIFIASGIAALFVALATVSWQAGKAALSNPVNCLRDE